MYSITPKDQSAVGYKPWVYQGWGVWLKMEQRARENGPQHRLTSTSVRFCWTAMLKPFALPTLPPFNRFGTLNRGWIDVLPTPAVNIFQHRSTKSNGSCSKCLILQGDKAYCHGPVDCFSKFPKVFGPISGATIPFLSSKRRGSKPLNFAILLVFLTLKTC